MGEGDVQSAIAHHFRALQFWGVGRLLHFTERD